MAFKQGHIGGNIGKLVSWLAVPRDVTLLILVAIGFSTGQVLWYFVESVKVLSWISGIATPFCMMCATIVWAMRDRLDDAVDMDLMTSQEYQRLIDLSRIQRSRATFWSAITGLMTLVSSFPAVSNQLIGPVWNWMIVGTGGAIAISIYAYLLANHWDHQVREYKNRRRIEGKKRAERQELIERLNESQPLKSKTGWVDGPSLINPNTMHH